MEQQRSDIPDKPHDFQDRPPGRLQAIGMDDRDRGKSISVSIVIVNYNVAEHLEVCLESLESLELNQPFEVIVVDNASTRGSLDSIERRFPTVRIIRNETNVGFAPAINIGVAAARGEFVAFLNPDMRVDSHWLQELLAPMRDEPDVACVGSMELEWDGKDVCFRGRPEDALALSYGHGAIPARLPSALVAHDYVLFVSGGSGMVRAEVFRHIGGFDSDYFMYHEDVDFGWRLWMLGYKCVLNQEAIVYHRRSASTKQFPHEFADHLHQRNLLFTLIKSLDWADLVSNLPMVLYFLIERSRRWEPAGRALPAVLDDLKNSIPSLLAKRKRLQAARVRSDTEIFGLLGHPLAFMLREQKYTEIRARLSARIEERAPHEEAAAFRAAVAQWIEAADSLVAEDYTEQLPISDKAFELVKLRVWTVDILQQTEKALRWTQDAWGQTQQELYTSGEQLKRTQQELEQAQQQIQRAQQQIQQMQGTRIWKIGTFYWNLHARFFAANRTSQAAPGSDAKENRALKQTPG
jgi:GT2 family glycosyltransferase